MKKVLIYTTILILLFSIPIIALLFGLRKGKLPEFINYHPKKFTYQSNKPLYFKFDNDLYYNENGTFDRKIKLISDIDEKYKLTEKYVSPDSKFILVYKENSILIISNKAQIIDKLVPVKSTFYFEHQEGKFWHDNIQWAENSKEFVIAKDEPGGNSYLYRYSIESGIIKPFLSTNIDGEYFISRDEKNVYHRQFNHQLNKFELLKTNLNTKTSIIISANGLSKELDSIFINYLDLGHSSDIAFGLCDTSIQIISKFNLQNIMSGIFISKKGALTNLIQIKNGYNAEKSTQENIRLSVNSDCFLPGDKFYILNCETNQNKGSIIIDIDNNKYMEIDRIDGDR
jgi:hypothetical protein